MMIQTHNLFHHSQASITLSHFILMDSGFHILMVLFNFKATFM